MKLSITALFLFPSAH